ncbi:hypothetical protein [Kitasatospora sp. NPDC004289]
MNDGPAVNPYDQPAAPRSTTDRLLRAGALVFLPPVAAIWLWDSRRLHVAAKVVLTVWCVLASLFWIDVIIGPNDKKPAASAQPFVTAGAHP